jgi:hypothetical protein
MRISSSGTDKFEIALTRSELSMLEGCMLEALELGVEFKTRIGTEPSEALSLMRAMRDALDRSK